MLKRDGRARLTRGTDGERGRGLPHADEDARRRKAGDTSARETRTSELKYRVISDSLTDLNRRDSPHARVVRTGVPESEGRRPGERKVIHSFEGTGPSSIRASPSFYAMTASQRKECSWNQATKNEVGGERSVEESRRLDKKGKREIIEGNCLRLDDGDDEVHHPPFRRLPQSRRINCLFHWPIGTTFNEARDTGPRMHHALESSSEQSARYVVDSSSSSPFVVVLLCLDSALYSSLRCPPAFMVCILGSSSPCCPQSSSKECAGRAYVYVLRAMGTDV